MKKTRPTYRPWHPAEYEPADVGAIKALASGNANEIQQKRALDFILHNVCRTYDETYFPGAEEGRRDSDFASGKRFVGNQIIKLTKITINPQREPK